MSQEQKFVVKSSMYNDNDVSYQVGDIVIHDIFGRGVVVGVDKTLIISLLANNMVSKK